jgi:hypothetical protein
VRLFVFELNKNSGNGKKENTRADQGIAPFSPYIDSGAALRRRRLL